MRRYEFEKLVQGDWKSCNSDRWRENGRFKTYIKKEWKFINDGKRALRAKSWIELARTLNLIPIKAKAGDKTVTLKNKPNWMKKRVKPKAFSNRKDERFK